MKFRLKKYKHGERQKVDDKVSIGIASYKCTKVQVMINSILSSKIFRVYAHLEQ